MLPNQIQTYINTHTEEAFALLQELAAIPAPSNNEEQRATFIKE
ncbi:hypothetical protein [uncultured Sphaerochaeta sp.]|nr:hypothetical protein [uncultured Sphaerochaeta sp.]